LEYVATRLNVANGAEHHALSDARLVKDVFLAMLNGIPTLKRISELRHISQPITFADAPVFSIDPPEGFEELTTAITERCPITIVYDRGSQRLGPRKITPRLMLEVHGVTYVVA
jgi:DNA polymerase III epsilon subunit-like protein